MNKEHFRLGRQLALGNIKSFAAAVMKIDEMKEYVYKEACHEIHKEVEKLCTLSEPSILCNTSKVAMQLFSWEAVNEELNKRTPIFAQFIKAAVDNPSHSRHVHKKEDQLLPRMCDAACKLISIFNENTTVPIRPYVLQFHKHNPGVIWR